MHVICDAILFYFSKKRELMSTPVCAGLQRVIGVYRKNRKNNVSSPTDQGCLICEETVKLVKVGAVVRVVCACARAF